MSETNRQVVLRIGYQFYALPLDLANHLVAAFSHMRKVEECYIPKQGYRYHYSNEPEEPITIKFPLTVHDGPLSEEPSDAAE